MKCKHCQIEYDLQNEVYTDFCSLECYNHFIYEMEKNKGEVVSMMEMWDWK
jgi:hypothetical protein